MLYSKEPVYYNDVNTDRRNHNGDGLNTAVLTLYPDHKVSFGYTKEAEKLERNDSKINLHIQLKAAATKKLRFRVWAHSLGEYLYILTKNGLSLRHRTNAINQSEEDLLQ